MGRDKLLAGHAIRRLRRRHALTQAAMAEMLEISPSYLNLIERNQRAIPAGLLVTLADRFDFDPRVLLAGEPGGGAAAIRRRLADPMFADLEVDRSEVEEWLAAAPGGAEAFARAFDRVAGGGTGGAPPPADDPAVTVRREIERWRNHFPDLDAAAERLADELRLVGADLYGALVERLRVRHGLSVRILPAEVLPDQRYRLDLHARQVQLAERLAPWSRTFALGVQVAAVEARAEIDALVRGAGLERTAGRLFRRHLLSYFAAAVMMPYARFLRACEGGGYDIDLLRRRFGAGFEHVAHRLTTLHRVGARGLPFFLLRIDRAGQVSKRLAGASDAPLLSGATRCPLWRVHHAFDRPGSMIAQAVEIEDGTRWFTIAQAVTGEAVGAGADRVESSFAIALGVPAAVAGGLAAARGFDTAGAATPIGTGCRTCHRAACPQRSAPPDGRALLLNERERGLSGWTFAGD